MTIYLPDSVSLFRQAFDAVCDRILQSKNTTAFYMLYVELIKNLREHPLLENFILELEAETTKHKQAFSIAALEALEDSWLRLWKYHRRLKHRKQLVHIKRMITMPEAISYSPLYNRILFSMWEFRYHSPFFRSINEAPRLFQSAQSEINLAPVQFDYSSSSEAYFAKRKVTQCKLGAKDKRRNLHNKIFNPGPPKKIMKFRRSAECVRNALFSRKIAEIEQKFIIPGQNDDEKRQNMQIMAETNPVICWERLRFLRECFIANGTFPAPAPFKGRWSSVREMAWNSARERCDIEVFKGAKMALGQKLSPDPCSSIDLFLMCEHRIHRRDYERYLHSLKNHIQAQLFKIESIQQKAAEENPLLVLPGTQKKNFVIDLANKCWKINPNANYDEVYLHYLINCPASRQLSRTSWERIIRKAKIDPRPKEAKKRGPGKKTLQN